MHQCINKTRCEWYKCKQNKPSSTKLLSHENTSQNSKHYLILLIHILIMFSLSYIRFMKIWNIFFRFFQKINPADTGPAGFENGFSDYFSTMKGCSLSLYKSSSTSGMHSSVDLYFIRNSSFSIIIPPSYSGNSSSIWYAV